MREMKESVQFKVSSLKAEFKADTISSEEEDSVPVILLSLLYVITVFSS